MNCRLYPGLPDIGRHNFYVGSGKEEMPEAIRIIAATGTAEGFNPLAEGLFFLIQGEKLVHDGRGS